MNFHKRINGWASRRRKRRVAARVGVAENFLSSCQEAEYFTLFPPCRSPGMLLRRRSKGTNSTALLIVLAAPDLSRSRAALAFNKFLCEKERTGGVMTLSISLALSPAPLSGGGSKNYTYAGEMTSWSIGQMTIKNRRHALARSLFRYCFLLPCQVVTLTRASIATIYHGRRRGNDMKMEVALFFILKCLWLCAFKGHKWVRNTLA